MKKFIVIVISSACLCSCSHNSKLSDAYGNFEADEIMVSSEMQGKLVHFNITEGMTIEKGFLAGIIDTGQVYLKLLQLHSQKKLAASKFAGIKAQIEVQEQVLKNLEKDRKRIEELLKDGAATEKQLDDLTGQIELTKKQMESIKSQFPLIENEIGTIETQILQVKDQLSRCRIINPITGTVITKYVEESELVSPGKNLYKIVNLNKMNLKAYISGAQLSKVKIGDKVNVLIDEDKTKNRQLEGIVSWISESAEFTPKIIQTKEERVNLVYAIKISVVNDGTLKIGMPGEVNFK